MRLAMGIQRRLAATFAFEPGEGRRIAWLSLHSLFLGTFIAFYFSAANALFLNRFQPAALPAAYIVSGLVGYAVVALFTPLEKRLSFAALPLCQLGFLIVLVSVLWAAAITTGSRWAAFALFVAITPAFTVLNLEFWGLAGRLFDLRQSKRLFGLLGCGEAVSAILGYVLVPCILHVLDDPLVLLPFAVLGLAACLAIVRRTAVEFPDELGGRPQMRAGAPPMRLAALCGNRYFLLIAALTALSVVANYLIDFSFLSQIRHHYPSAEQMAAFISVFYGVNKVLELLMKSFLAGRLLTQFGLRLGLAALPLTLLVCLAAAAAAGTIHGQGVFFFLLIALTKLVWLVLRRSLFEPALRVLFQPLPEEERLAFQSRAEGLVQQLSVGLVGLLLLAAVHGGAGALQLSYALLPALALTVAVVSALYREYRARLMQSLAARSAVMTYDTRPAPAFPAQPSRAAQTLLAAVFPTAAELVEVRRVMVRPAAILPLLWDRDPAVRRRALLAAGRSGDESLRARLFDHLEMPAFAGVAAHAVVSLGESAVPDLQAAFNRARSVPLKAALLKIGGEIGGARAQSFLFQHLAFPERTVQLQALLALEKSGARAGAGQTGLVKRRIEDLVEMAAWGMAAWVGLAGEPACAATRAALDLDLQGYRRSLFRLLALLCDARAVRLARERLEKGQSGSRVYALEILDVVVPEDIKPLLLPVLEGLPPAQCLSRLESFTAPPRHTPLEWLSAVLHREHGVLSVWAKACAVQALGEMTQGQAGDDLIALLFHPDPVLQEAAAEAIFLLDTADYARHVRKLLPADRERLDRLVGAGGGLPALSAFTRARLLRKAPPFAELSRDTTLVLGTLAAESRLSPGETLEPAPGPAAIHLVLAGSLAGAQPGETLIADRTPLHATEPVHLLTLEGDRLLILLARQPALAAAVMGIQGAKQQAIEQATATEAPLPSLVWAAA
jgi:hypothetical protein